MAVLHDAPGRSWPRTRTRGSSSRFRRAAPDANVDQTALYGAAGRARSSAASRRRRTSSRSSAPSRAAPPPESPTRPSAAWSSSPGASASATRYSCFQIVNAKLSRPSPGSRRRRSCSASARRPRWTAGPVRHPVDGHAGEYGPGGRRHGGQPRCRAASSPTPTAASSSTSRRATWSSTATRRPSSGSTCSRSPTTSARCSGAGTSTTSTSRATATRSSRRSSARRRLNPSQLGDYYVPHRQRGRLCRSRPSPR